MAYLEPDDHTIRQLIKDVCTEKEQQVLRFIENGVSIRQIARILGISRSSVRSRIESAKTKLDRALEERAAN